jgi:hypothetical protein
MLVVLYAAPAAFGLYVFRDRYASLFMGCLLASLAAYYAGYWGGGWLQQRAAMRGAGLRIRAAPATLEWAALAIVGAYLLLVIYLALSAERIALLAALGLGGASDVTEAREAFVQSRTGAERILVYGHTIALRTVLPVAVVFLYMRSHRWRHLALGLSLLAALVSLEKSLPLFLLVPLLTFFLLTGRQRTASRVLVLSVAALALAAALASGVLEEFYGTRPPDAVQLVSERPDRRNLFWVGGKQSSQSSIHARDFFGREDKPVAKLVSEWQSLALRNRLSNGAMQLGEIDAIPRSGTLIDYWYSHQSIAGKLAFELSADAPRGFTRSLKIAVRDSHSPLSDEVFELRQAIEGYKVRDLGFGSPDAQEISVSFWVKASMAGHYNITVGNGGFTRSYLTEYVVTQPQVWEHKTIAVRGERQYGAAMWLVNAADAIVLNFNFGAGEAYRTPLTNAWQGGFFRQSQNGLSLVEHQGATLQLTGVQLEAGPRATAFEHRGADVERDLSRRFRHRSENWRSEAAATRGTYLLNRALWIPYITGYDWFRYQDEVLNGRQLHGTTAGVLAWVQSRERFPAEKEIFKYQFGEGAPTATANAVFFADAYLNFGWPGVLVSSAIIGIIFSLLATSASLPVFAVSVMSAFSLMIASFTANLLSGGLLIMLALALCLQSVGEPRDLRSQGAL